MMKSRSGWIRENKKKDEDLFSCVRQDKKMSDFDDTAASLALPGFAVIEGCGKTEHDPVVAPVAPGQPWC